MKTFIDGGGQTARVSAAEEDRAYRAQREADALNYLTRTGNDDLAPMLGLAESPKPKRKPRRRVASGGDRP